MIISIKVIISTLVLRYRSILVTDTRLISDEMPARAGLIVDRRNNRTTD